MSNTIRIKRSSTAAAVPTAGQLQQGELAVNLADKKLYTKDQANAVVLLNPDPPPGFDINSLTTETPATGDFLPFADISDSNNAKKATVANVVALGLNATGAAPVFAARAWVNFNGTGTVAIRASGNVSSITNNATGDNTINFATAMPDANYSAVATAHNPGVATAIANFTETRGAGSAKLVTYNDVGGVQDCSTIDAAFFR